MLRKKAEKEDIKVSSEDPTAKVILSKDLKKELAMQISGRRTYQPEVTASAKVLRQCVPGVSDKEQRSQFGWNEPKGVEWAVFARPPDYIVFSPGTTTSGTVDPWKLFEKQRPRLSQFRKRTMIWLDLEDIMLSEISQRKTHTV